MTDRETLQQVISLLAPSVDKFPVIHRNKHIFLAIPDDRDAASRTLSLYQPQRYAGRILATTIRALTTFGGHRFLPKFESDMKSLTVLPDPPLPSIASSTVGFMMGSPDHSIPRVIASYRTSVGWEVAKISFGPAGADLLSQEAKVLFTLSRLESSVPSCRGLHTGGGITVLRMPYLSGSKSRQGEYVAALDLMENWISSSPPRAMPEFGEWESVSHCLSTKPKGDYWIDKLSSKCIIPSISHGDFARWNLLKQPNGKLMLLDWEWGREQGLPGIDLAHYFLQDDRLVRRLSDREAIASTIKSLEQPRCRAYLAKTGWTGDPLDVIVTSLAYKQGARHQENTDILQVALSFRE